MDLIFAFLGGAGVAGTAVFFYSRRYINRVLLQATTDSQDQNQRLGELQRLLNQEQMRCAMLEERASRVSPLESQLFQRMQESISLRARTIELSSALEHERRQAQEKIALLEEAQTRLSQTFKALSADALSANNQSFLNLATSALEKFQESAKTDLTTRQKAISDMLTPVHQALGKVDIKLLDLEKERVGAYQVLRSQVAELVNSQKELRLETSNLVKALRTPSVRGQWGEMQLKRVVEMAGMVAYCDFAQQVSVEGENGRLRPDMVVNLPGGKKIIVDAKAPLSAYLESLEAPDDQARSDKLVEHARQVRAHIRALSQRAYWDQFESTPEFVVLFLPGETFFSAALEKDPTLIEAGVREKVILATPTTLIALLRSVSYGWRQESIAENAKAISDLGRELYKRVSDMGSHIARMGRHLGQVVDSYNQTVGTLERRVLVSARKFKTLDPSNEDIDELAAIDHTPRHLQSLELVGEEELLPSLPLGTSMDVQSEGEAA
ncbi:MAG: polymerase [Alphaproteobacteria bacterium]|jgi:DNA recombination protein RmuC|nr:polymerase [Alphaproteobacteria bacterium]